MPQLFELKSQVYDDVSPVPAGESAALKRVCPKRCLVSEIRMPVEVREHFTVIRVFIGVNPIKLVRTERGFLLRYMSAVPLAEHGYDIHAEVRNDSEEPAQFSCDFWGELAPAKPSH